MIINCTKRLIKEFDVALSPSNSLNPSLFNDIYAHYFTIGGANFVIFLEKTTLFSIFYIEEDDHQMELHQSYLYSLAITLECYDYEKSLIKKYLEQLSHISCVSLTKKSILPILNVKIRHFKKLFFNEFNKNGIVNIENITQSINGETYSKNFFSSPQSIFLNQLSYIRVNNHLPSLQ